MSEARFKSRLEGTQLEVFDRAEDEVTEIRREARSLYMKVHATCCRRQLRHPGTGLRVD
jgi:hypothetical protein